VNRFPTHTLRIALLALGTLLIHVLLIVVDWRAEAPRPERDINTEGATGGLGHHHDFDTREDNGLLERLGRVIPSAIEAPCAIVTSTGSLWPSRARSLWPSLDTSDSPARRPVLAPE